ncbi:globin [Dyadobacter sp. CY261]|uniref:globin n=1 Tax=Dyadobacter sp. CY261 TaxID=2907203 RepID=UPI001F21E8C0|nr:globin [Dyadobacter sp. CY261]MCF0074714.1 globin [Dyadobacter sp. CY261]
MEQVKPTNEQIRLVKQEWSFMKNIRPHVLGDVFFGKLFFDYPQTRKPVDRLLSAGLTNDLNEGLKNVLGGIISKLDRPDELSIRMQGLALSLKTTGFNQTVFQRLAESLIWTLKKAFGDEWPTESELAWTACIGLVEYHIFGQS